MPELLRTEKLVRRYVMGEAVITAVDDVNLKIEAGEMVAILGRSGSGKSTLLHLLGGLDRPTSGEILVGGERLTERSDDELALYRRHKVGFIFQFFNLVPSMSALQNVELPLILAGDSAAGRRELARRSLEAVGLGGRIHHRPSELSGGEQQRVAVARALIHNPPLLLADEPTGNLDTKTAAEILDLLKSLNAQGKTIVVVTHDRTLAKAYAQHTIEMSDGRVATDSRGAA